MESVHLDQPRRIEIDTDSLCGKGHGLVLRITTVEVRGVTVEKRVVGSYRQSLDADGFENGPIIAHCLVCEAIANSTTETTSTTTPEEN